MLTAERLRAVLRYEPETGVFTWRHARRGVVAGSIAGCLSKESGYVLICIDGCLYRAHRLAWLYVKRQWPPRLLDHRDRDRANNRWTNIRMADDKQNSENTSLRSDNESGIRGVAWNRGRWRARIFSGGREIHLGRFDDLLSAAGARLAAERKHFTHSEGAAGC
jgi:hypothetical protein